MQRAMKIQLQKDLTRKVERVKHLRHSNLSSEEFLEVFLNASLEKVYQNSLSTTPNIKIIAQKVDFKLCLTLDEIQYLLRLSYKAYNHTIIKQVKADYVLDCYHALIDILKELKWVSDDAAHYLSNLCPHVHNKDTWVKSLEEIKHEFTGERKVQREQGLRVTQCLNALTYENHFRDVNVFCLNQKFESYYRSLITLAKHSILQEVKTSQLHATNTNELYGEILTAKDISNNQVATQNIKNDHFHLSIAYQLYPIGLLSLKIKDDSYGCIDLKGKRFFDLVDIFMSFHKGVFPVFGNEITLWKLSEDTYALEHGATKLYLSSDCAESIKQTIESEYKRKEKYFSTVAYQLGDI